MKKLLVLFMALVLAAGCTGGNTNTTTTESNEKPENTTVYENDFNYVFTSDMTTFDYLTNSRSSNGDHLNNWVEGLITQDPYGNLVPGMATGWESNEDSTVWTFQIRDDATWVTNGQEEYSAVTAQDFVTGLQHAADFDSSTIWLVGDLIVGLQDYIDGKVGWEEVGVKADGNTLTYTLTSSTPYFDSITTYAILYPVNQEFLESQGDGCKLGAPNPETCKFGSVDATSILYNGAYVLSNYTSKSVIEYDKNEAYWDVENVHIPHVKLIYNDGNDPDFLFNLFDKGDSVAATVMQTNPATVAKAKEKYSENLYITDTTSSTFYASFNYNRKAYASFADPSKGISPKTDAQKADTKAAVLNKNFRLAVFAAFNTSAYGAQTKGEELALSAARNTLTAYNFVKTSDGKLYGDLVTDLMKKESAIFKDSSFVDGQDAYYNPEQAKAYMEEAIKELGDSVTFPIYLDVPVDETTDVQVRRAQAIKQSVEEALGEYVQLNLVLMDQDNYYNSWYYPESGMDSNFDLIFNGGWGPDYADPRTYLNIFLSDNGDVLNMLGLSLESQNAEGDKKIKEQIGLTKYTQMVREADAILDDKDARFAKFAEAEAYLLSEGIIRPFTSNGGNYGVSRVVPYSGAYGLYGAASYNQTPTMKYLQVGDKIVTAAEHDAAKEAWLAEQAK